MQLVSKGWSLRSILRESLRNNATSPGRTALICLAASILIAFLAASELIAATRLIDFQEKLAFSGGYVAVVASERGIDAARCEALSLRPEVVSSGGVLESEVVDLVNAPGTLFQSGAATIGSFGLWQRGRRNDTLRFNGSVGLGDAAAAELGLVDGLTIQRSQDLETVAVVKTEPRNPQVSRWIISIIPPAGLVDQCWLEFSPGMLETGMAAVDMVFADASPAAATRPLFTLDEFSRQPATELARRPEAGAWIPAAGVLTLVGWLVIWSRRSEYGLYLALGSPWSAVLLLAQLELVVALVPASAAGFLWGASLHAVVIGALGTWDQYSIALRTASSGILAALALMPLAAILVGRARIMDLLKDT